MINVNMAEIFMSIMLDGNKSGVILGDRVDKNQLKTEITSKTYEYLYRQITSLEHSKGKDLISIKLKLNGSQSKVSLNKWNGRFFFNVEGNPTSFNSGQNIFGAIDLPSIIKLYYTNIGKALKKKIPDFKMPKEIRDKVENLDICVTSLAFACYSPPIPGGIKTQENLLDAIEHIFCFSVPDMPVSTVKKFLNLKITREGNHSIRIDKFFNKKRLWSLTLYNKWVEQLEADKQVKVNWVKDKIRFDLTFHAYWFRKNKLFTLGKIHELYGMDYMKWIDRILEKHIEQTKIAYCLGFSLDVDKGDYQEEFDEWVQGDSPTDKECIQWFLNQNLDLRLPYDMHVLAILGRSTFDMDVDHARKAVLGYEDAIKNLNDGFNSKLINGLNNSKFKKLQKHHKLLKSGENILCYRYEDKYINVETGECL